MNADHSVPVERQNDAAALDRALWLLGYSARRSNGRRWIDIGSTVVRLAATDGELEVVARWNLRSTVAEWTAPLPGGIATDVLAREVVAVAEHLRRCEEADVLIAPPDWVRRRLVALLQRRAGLAWDVDVRAQLAFRCWRDDPCRSAVFDTSWQLQTSLQWRTGPTD